MPRNKKKLKKWYGKWLQKRRADIFRIIGEKCAKCGTKEKLEIDHINPETKKFKVSPSCSLDRIMTELEKCQALCETCHNEKTRKENKQRYKGISNFRCRKIEDEKFIEFYKLIKNGKTQKEASKIVGISMSTYSSTKSRGYRKEVWEFCSRLP